MVDGEVEAVGIGLACLLQRLDCVAVVRKTQVLKYVLPCILVFPNLCCGFALYELLCKNKRIHERDNNIL